MSDSVSWKITKYIDDYAAKSRMEYTYKHLNTVATALFKTIVSLKKYGASKEYIEDFEKRILAQESIFIYLCLLSHRRARDMRAIEHLVQCSEPLGCSILHEIFEATNRQLIPRLQVVNPRIPYETLLELIMDVDDACKLLILNFSETVNQKNLSNRIEDELILIEEVESLKNRKEKYNEGIDSSDK